jgi:hypothetical protein
MQKESEISEELSIQGTPFDIDDIVWAKVKGFPWWPSIVRKPTLPLK